MNKSMGILKGCHPQVKMTSLIVVFMAILGASCGDKAKEKPEPDAVNYTHTIILNSNVEGAAAKVWNNNSIKKTGITNVSGQVILKPINQQVTTEYDSITLDKAGHTRWKVINQSVGTSKTYYPSLDEITAATYDHNIAINSNVEGGTFKVWNNGSILNSGTSNSAGLANLTFTNTETSTLVDSITGKKDGYDSWKVVNQTIGQNENYTATLADIIHIMLQGQTIDLLKDSEPPYIGINSGEITEEYKSTRLEPNMSFTIFNKSGSFEKLVTSNSNANFSVELPAQGDYGILIDLAGKHPMMYKIIIDEETNTEVIASMSDVLSLYNFAQSHMGYKPSDADESVLEPTGQFSRTFNWSKQILEDGIRLLYMDKILDLVSGASGESTNEEMKTIMQNTRNYIDNYENNFFSSKNLETVQDNSEFTTNGVLAFAYGTNSAFSGLFGKTVNNGVVVKAAIGINKQIYDNFVNNGSEFINTAMLQENSSAFGAFYELYKEEEGKPSIWHVTTNLKNYSEDSKNATNFYHWLSNKLLTENTDAEGFYSGLIDSRMINEFKNNAKVLEFVQTHSPVDVQQKYD